MCVNRYPCPDESNGYLADLAREMRISLCTLTGRDLVDPALDDLAAAKAMFHAPFVLLCHDAAEDPVFVYGNLSAMRLFELDWSALTAMPSRLTAEAPNRAERERLLAAVSSQGFIDDYGGVRISAAGRRFRIERAIVWNVFDPDGRTLGQAASFADWRHLDPAG